MRGPSLFFLRLLPGRSVQIHLIQETIPPVARVSTGTDPSRRHRRGRSTVNPNLVGVVHLYRITLSGSLRMGGVTCLSFVEVSPLTSMTVPSLVLDLV